MQHEMVGVEESFHQEKRFRLTFLPIPKGSPPGHILHSLKFRFRFRMTHYHPTIKVVEEARCGPGHLRMSGMYFCRLVIRSIAAIEF